MSIFISGNERVRVALPDDPENAIYIRPRLNSGQSNYMKGKGLVLGTDGKPDLNMGENLNAKMEVNFVAWEGPKFTLPNGKVAPCTPQYQLQLDPTDPLVQLALKEIDERNKEASSPDPKSPDSSGSMDDGATS